MARPTLREADMPKTHPGLWDKIISWDNLFAAYEEARRGKRYSAEVLRFAATTEEGLADIHDRLIWGSWRPSRMVEFFVHEPKKRLIHAPQFKDRVVHHALVRVISPIVETKFIADSYACRSGKGTHAAMYRAQQFLRSAKVHYCNPYILKADISAYFLSVHHDVLKRIVRRTIRCPRTLDLIDHIIDHGSDGGRGIPIGALTSQLFANMYLDVLDHYVKEDLGAKWYLRYMDDFVVIHEDKVEIRRWLGFIDEFLAGVLGLNLNPKTAIFPARHGLDFVGYRIWPTHVLPRKRNIVRAKRRLSALSRLYSLGKRDIEDIRLVVTSFLGYVRHCSAYITVRKFLSECVFRRGGLGFK